MEWGNIIESIEKPGEVLGVGVDFWHSMLFTADLYKLRKGAILTYKRHGTLYFFQYI